MSRPKKDMEAQYSAYMKVLDKVAAHRERKSAVEAQILAIRERYEAEIDPLKRELDGIVRKIAKLFDKAGSAD